VAAVPPDPAVVWRRGKRGDEEETEEKKEDCVLKTQSTQSTRHRPIKLNLQFIFWNPKFFCLQKQLALCVMQPSRGLGRPHCPPSR
jgi:hypothetical protein